MNIDEIELRRLDLTVLLVFINLMRLRKASDVADHMGLTQSSISHSIKRLRDAFGDPLFLRTPKGMEPTAVALGLEPKIRSVVETLSQAISTPVDFDPASSTDTLRIGAFDNEMTTLVPRFLQVVRAEAPGMRVSILPLGRRPAIDALEQGDIDLALGFAWNLPRSIKQTKLFNESYSVVMRQGHPLAQQQMTLKAYTSAEHLIVSPRGDHTGIVDEELENLRTARRVIIAVPQFLPALAIVATTDLIATLPSRLVASQSRRYQLLSFPPPVEIRPFTVSAMHHERNSNSPMHQWAIAALSEIAGDAPLS
ncbi:MAG: LysR family transcriptional regulator [Pseudomonadota bacterium]